MFSNLTSSCHWIARWRAIALIGFALVGPAGLPAGGGDIKVPAVRRRVSASEPLISPAEVTLHCEPRRQAPVIAQAAAGQPLRLLQRWCGAGGQAWLLVEVGSGSGRGWLREVDA